MDVRDTRPASSTDGPMEISAAIDELRVRPQYADTDPLDRERSHGNEEHHHGDPITGHIAMMSWP